MKRKSKNSGRAISMALAASMLVAPVNVVLAASTDIHGHWAEKSITEWQDKGLISGYQDGTFKPNGPTTRAEFARIMNQALGLSSKGKVAFSDVSASDWYYNDVAIALGEAYTVGYPDGSFKPNETITRAQAAVFIANAIGASGGSVEDFSDSSDIPAWAKNSVGAIVEKGYMSGYPDGTFNPNAVLTRAEAVSTLNRIMEAGTKETTVTEKDVVVDKDDTKIENQTIEGNLTISEKVGDGEVYLSNVEIKGDLIIQGGGDDSIYTDNVVVKGKTLLDKQNVRLQVSGETNLSKVEIKKVCNFSSRNFSGEVGTITITAEISDETTIDVPADSLYVNEKANLLIKKAIGEVVVDEDAAGTKLELDKAAKVSTLTVDGKTALSGSGTISILEANVGDITYTSGLTISKTVTASGVNAPTKATISGGGSSSSSSSVISIASVSTKAQFEAAVADNNITTINVAGDISDSIDATRTGSRSLTINFGAYTMGNVSITAAAVTAITLNDSGVGGAGASIANLEIDAENAHVVNNVQVSGTITIWAVSHSTFVQDDVAALVDLRGPGTLEFPAVTFGISPPPPVFVNTDEPIRFTGTFGTIGVFQPNAQLDFAGDTQVQQLNVDAGAAGGTFTGGVGANIGLILTGAGLTFAGSGTVGEVQVIGNTNLTITGSASSIGSITNTGSGMVTSTDGIPICSKSAAPTNLVTVAATGAAIADGQITGTTIAMEYKLASSNDGAYVSCTAFSTTVAPGTYFVRVKTVGSILRSDPVQVVIGVKVTSATITGTAQVGQNLTAAANTGATNVTYQWQANTGTNGVYENIANATSATFAIPASLVGKTIKVVISGADASTAISDETGAVVAAKAVAGVSNIHVGLTQNDTGIDVLFDQPTNLTGIEAFRVELSTDGGATWGNTYEGSVDSDIFCSIDDLTRFISGTTTYNKVKVTSLAESGYVNREVTANISYTFTVTGTAPAFTVENTGNDAYEITLAEDVVSDAIYIFEVTKDNVEQYEYSLGISIPSSRFDGRIINIENSSISDGSSFDLRVIKPYSTTGLTVTNKSAKVAINSVAGALATAKTDAKQELTTALTSYTQGDYDAEEWIALTTAKTDGDAAIDNATDTAGVTTAKETAIAAMDEVLTIAEKAATPSVPAVAVTNVQFTDTDTNTSQIGGLVTWTEPADTSNITHYVVYASEDGTTKGNLLGTEAVGTSQLEIYADTAYTQYIIVVAKNAEGEAESANYASVAVTDDTSSYVASSSATLDITPETGTKLAGVVLTDDGAGYLGTSELDAIWLSVTIPAESANNAVFVPVTENANVTAYIDYTGQGGGSYAVLAPNYTFTGDGLLWIKVISEDGSKILYYNVYVTLQ
ncbi:MAG TPA: hypothetical protein DIC60_02670 [Lachnospiraceae bacterium]|nr:hypothetical protein [Lachnospiraceae bacterium]